MSLVLILLLTAVAVGLVVHPLWGHVEEGRPAQAVAAQAVLIADGVAYGSKEEWAVERALDKAGQGEPDLRVYRAQSALEAAIEERVAALREEWREARAQSRRTLCPRCGKPFQAGDRFCARCGELHPTICAQCGERYRPGDRFCTRCGTALPGGTE